MTWKRKPGLERGQAFTPYPHAPAKLIYLIGQFNGVLWGPGPPGIFPSKGEKKEQRNPQLRERQREREERRLEEIVRKTFSFSAGLVLFLENKRVEAVDRFSLIVDIKRRERKRTQ